MLGLALALALVLAWRVWVLGQALADLRAELARADDWNKAQARELELARRHHRGKK